MTLDLTLLVKANAGQAKAELAAVGAELQKVDGVVRAGTVSQGAANQVLKETQDDYLAIVPKARAASAAQEMMASRSMGVAKGASSAGYQAKLLGQQLSQVAQQGAATGQWAQAFAIQAADVGMAFGPIGIGAGILITLLPTLASAFGESGTAAMTLAEATDASSSAVADAISSMQKAYVPLDELTKKYGGAATAVRDYLKIIAEGEQLTAMEAMQVRIDAIVDSIGMLYVGNRGSPALTEFGREIGLTLAQAKELQAAIADVGRAKGYDAQVAAVQALNAELFRIYGSLDAMPPAMRKLATETASSAEQAALLNGSTSNILDAVTALAKINPQMGWIDSAIGRAGTLATKLWDAANAAAANRISTMDPTSAGFLATQYTAYGQGHKAMDAATDPLYNAPPVPNGTKGGSGGGAGSANEVQAYIDGLRQEMELMRTLDPVQQEMIKNRDMMAKATSLQRAEIEELVAAQQAEVNLGDAMNFFGDASYDALSGLILQGKSAADVMKNLEKAILQAALQALVLGEGPLAGIFGTKGTSLFGIVAAGLGFGGAKAGGGMIWGEGGARDDKVMIAASPGEYVVNGRATAANRGLLEFINGGGSPSGRFAGGRFAGGGAVGGGQGALGSGAAGGATPPVAIHIDARGAQMGVADQIAATLRDMAPQFGRLAVEAVRSARGRGVAV